MVAKRKITAEYCKKKRKSTRILKTTDTAICQKNAKPDYKLYDNILSVSDTCRVARQHKEEEELQIQAKRQERIEREKREMDEHINRNNAFVNSYLEKKQAEQEAIRKAREEKRKEKAEQQELYNSIDRLMNISPKLAEAFIEARTHTWKQYRSISLII